MPDERTPQKQGLIQSIIVKLVPQTFSLLQRSQSSVEIRRSPKGPVEFTIKCYADSIEEAQANGLQAFINLSDKIKGFEKSDATD
jgi:hypothetical protein